MSNDISGGADIKTGSSSSTPPGGNDNAGGVIIEESQESEEYQQDLRVVVATACSVIAVVGLIALAFFAYRIYRARHRAPSYGHADDNDIFENNISVDIVEKRQPVILMLYANDCPIHEKVVQALASFLMETCGVVVTLDLLEESEILERGIDDWLVDRLQEADYILVLASLGARLRCSKKRVRFKQENRRLLPDYFSVAVDYTAEKMRAEKQKGLSSNKFITAYMEYSTRSDIPPQLEMAAQFCLMKDIHALHTHLNTFGPDKSDSGSQCEQHYQETDTGAILKATIEQAKAYFKENPDWMDQRLEEPSFPFRMNPQRKRRRRNSLEQPLLVLTGRPPVLSNVTNNQDTEMDFSMEHLLTSREGQSRLQGSGLFQSRQNSLPSSLTSVPQHVQQLALSKSLDSFGKDAHIESDGLPCFYCNSSHMDGHCRRHRGSLSNLHPEYRPESQCSLDVHSDSRSRSQTILQAEVHQEWGTTHTEKSVTLPGDPRSMGSGEDTRPWVPFQSLPPHQVPPPCSPSSTEWDHPVPLHRWRHQSTIPESPSLTGPLKPRTLSDASFSTEDSESLSETDSLERDLRSIQHISSFRDFVASSSFVTVSSLTKTSPMDFAMSSSLHPTEIKLQYTHLSHLSDATQIV